MPIAGQTWASMAAAAADVDSALVAAGEFSALLTWETSNQVNGGSSIADCKLAILKYVEGRFRVRPGVPIGIMESLPRAGVNYTYHTLAGLNQRLQEIDEWVWANAHRYGWEFITIRTPGSPFRFTEFTSAAFDATQDYWYESSGIQTHCTPEGYRMILPEVQKWMYRIKVR